MDADDVPESDARWEARESGPVPLPPLRRRERIGEVSAGAPERHSEVTATTPRRVTLAEVARTSAELDRRVGPEMDEEEVLAEYLATFAGLFEGRRFVVRLVDEGGGVDLLRSTGALSHGRHEDLRVTRAGLLRAGVSASAARRAGLRVVERYLSDFEEDGVGFDLLLVEKGAPVGVLAVETRGRAPLPEGDVELMQMLAIQLSCALSRAQLRQEASYLSSYLSRLLDRANVPIVVIDSAQRMRVISRALLDLLGFGRGELVDEPLEILLSSVEQAKLLPAVVGALHGRAIEPFEVALRSKPGGAIRLAMDLVALHTPSGEVHGVIAIGRDLTEVRELESQVIQAEKLATLGQLAAGVVHELNNPLTSISVYGEYLYKKGLREEAPAADVEKLRRIVQSAERILRFTRDLVTYARPSSEVPRRLDVHEVLDQATVFCEHILVEAHATIERRYRAEAARILGVRGQLHQVFINLITNACHAMPEGAGRMRLETRLRPPDRLEIRVHDNGAGIPEEQRDRIFDPFFSTKGEGKGTGLGLSIVRNIVQMHGGAIRVESRPGDGTAFVVVLPLSE